MDGTSVSGTDARGSCEEPSLELVSLGELLDSWSQVESQVSS